MRLKFLKGRNSEKGPVEVQLMWLEGDCSAVGVGVPQKSVMRLALQVLEKLPTSFGCWYSTGRKCLAR